MAVFVLPGMYPNNMNLDDAMPEVTALYDYGTAGYPLIWKVMTLGTWYFNGGTMLHSLFGINATAEW